MIFRNIGNIKSLATTKILPSSTSCSFMSEQTTHRPTLRVLKILEILSETPAEGLTLSELAHQMSTPASSLLPFAKTLATEGYLTMSESTMRYSLGYRCLSFSAAFMSTSDAYSVLKKEMEAATEACEEICQAGILRGGNVFYVAKEDAPQALRLVSSVGKLVPATATAIGKALLCDHSREQICALYPTGLPTLTDFSITDIDVIMRQLYEIKSGGFARDVDESLLHLRCFALPIRVNGRIDCAISISTPSFRMNSEKEEHVKKLLSQARDHIEKKFSYLNRGISG